MSPPARLFGPDRVEDHRSRLVATSRTARKGRGQWRNGYSAKEQAKAWLRSGRSAIPAELWSSISDLGPVGVDEVYGRPEHQTRLDRYSAGRAEQRDSEREREGGVGVAVDGQHAMAATSEQTSEGPRDGRLSHTALLHDRELH